MVAMFLKTISGTINITENLMTSTHFTAMDEMIYFQKTEGLGFNKWQ